MSLTFKTAAEEEDNFETFHKQLEKIEKAFCREIQKNAYVNFNQNAYNFELYTF